MEWTTYQLSDVCTIKKRGVTPKEGVCYALYSLPAFDKSKKPEIVYGQEIKSNKFSIQNNTILFNKLNVRFKRVWNIKELKHSNNICSTEFFPLSVKGDVEQDFLYYYLISDHITEILKKSLSGTSSSHQRIDLNLFLQLPINLPSISDQRKIAGILSALDAKIENNNKINANLEAQAEALFKSWFVDFTPCKDQPFVDSELGSIPQGWKVGKLGDIGEIVGGSTPSKSKPEYYTTHGIAWLTPKDLSTSKAKFTSRGEIDITDEGYNSTSTKLMPRGSVLFSSRAPIGYLTIAKNEICTNQGFKSLVPNGAGTGFIYYTLRHLTPQIENRATGSTFKEASATLMRSVETIVPPTSILNKFEELLRPILQFQEKKEEENQRLAALRDTLLPKLMSGEIKL